jgi:hypothetical protein
VSKEDFKNEHMLKLQGKEYLPVAPRVVMFRKEHPDYSILTETRDVGGDTYVFAAVVSEKGLTLATAHKRVRKDGKGPAALWPLETAETGAIGRALALCGYGTLSGDLDEGDELADAPVEKAPTSKPKTVSTNNASVASLVAALEEAKDKAAFDAAYSDALDFAEGLSKTSEEFVQLQQATVRARNRVAKKK